MTHHDKPEMAITERELSAMTGELDMPHKETFPGVRKTLDDFSANLAGKNFGRRGFLAGLGGVAVLGTVAACSSSKKSDKSSAPNSPAGDRKSVV